MRADYTKWYNQFKNLTYKGENNKMAKEKTFLIHTLKKFPDDLESLFDKFIANLELVEIQMPTTVRVSDGPSYGHGAGVGHARTTATVSGGGVLTIVEIGPRDDLTTIFQLGPKKQFKIEFARQKDNLIINLSMAGMMAKQYKKSIAPYIIKSVNSAVREMN